MIGWPFSSTVPTPIRQVEQPFYNHRIGHLPHYTSKIMSSTCLPTIPHHMSCLHSRMNRCVCVVVCRSLAFEKENPKHCPPSRLPINPTYCPRPAMIPPKIKVDQINSRPKTTSLAFSRSLMLRVG